MKWAAQCFSSLRKSSVSVQTIVVDNGSTDGTQDYIKNNFPEVELVQSPKNLGFGKANNLGLEMAYNKGADFFYLMNQDAWLFEDSIQQLLNVYDHYPTKEEIGIISPMHLDGSGKKLDIFFENYLARNNIKNNFISDSFCGKLKPYYEMDFVNAAHWLLPTTTVEEVGGFNPYFFHYSEDMEYTNRIIFHGKKTILCTASLVVHDGKQDWSKTDHINAKRVQREQRFLDPGRSFSSTASLKDFYSDITKMYLKGQFANATEHWKELGYQKKRFAEIEAARAIIARRQASFLNLKEKK